MYESRHTEDFFSRFLIAHPEIKVDIFQYPYGALTEKLKMDGYEVISGPRTTGDGYYESCIIAIEGNLIEITI